MIRDGTAERVAVTNRQRRLGIHTRRLTEIAERALDLVNDTPFRSQHRAGDDDVAMAKLNARYHDTLGATDILKVLIMATSRNQANSLFRWSTPSHGPNDIIRRQRKN